MKTFYFLCALLLLFLCLTVAYWWNKEPEQEKFVPLLEHSELTKENLTDTLK